ncbi:hypothetical protein [Actinacidiphila paucisporea]|uniref:Uncharacterized protein n=1 Tax=Actinacidiphila paucisporea TaxID=310782 RepID=A0A1M7K4K3_9ACTN|nr:hypothetical protein [Actinacidiphila paucisporea]SHM60188.1 hypothetical protein SAMN05216499_112145 [Actinacidiphila paucisporea]
MRAWLRRWRAAGGAAFAVMALAAVAAVAGAAVSAAPAAAATATGVTSFSYTSTAGEPVGLGQSATFTAPTAAIDFGSHADYLRMDIKQGAEYWEAEFRPPTGQLLSPGVYRDAERVGFATGRDPGLSISGDSRGCNIVWGQFSVDQLETDASGAVTVFDASFTQRCDSATAPALTGTVKYHALPLSYSYKSDGTADYIGAGLSNSYTGSTSTFRLINDEPGGEVSVPVSGKRDTWRVDIAPPAGTTLKAGSTYQAGNVMKPGLALLDASGDSRGCNTSTGSFTVDAIRTGADGLVTAISLRYTQYCEGSTKALHGTVHYLA